jgi:hypothetical protein
LDNQINLGLECCFHHRIRVCSRTISHQDYSKTNLLNRHHLDNLSNSHSNRIHLDSWTPTLNSNNNKLNYSKAINHQEVCLEMHYNQLIQGHCLGKLHQFSHWLHQPHYLANNSYRLSSKTHLCLTTSNNNSLKAQSSIQCLEQNHYCLVNNNNNLSNK